VIGKVSRIIGIGNVGNYRELNSTARFWHAMRAVDSLNSTSPQKLCHQMTAEVCIFSNRARQSVSGIMGFKLLNIIQAFN
jgi:hypothetical protein